MNLESVAALRAATPRAADRPARGWSPEGVEQEGKPDHSEPRFEKMRATPLYRATMLAGQLAVWLSFFSGGSAFLTKSRNFFSQYFSLTCLNFKTV